MDLFENETLKFPLVWHGRLVTMTGTPDVVEQVQRIYAAVGVTDGRIDDGRVSSKGTYTTWPLQGTVMDQAMLRALFKALETLPGVRMLF